MPKLELWLVSHGRSVQSVAYSPDGLHFVSGSNDQTIRIWNTKVPQDTHPFDLHPDEQGWVKDSNGGLLFWVPADCRNGLTCPAILTIPTKDSHRTVRLDLSEFRFGPSWEQIMKG